MPCPRPALLLAILLTGPGGPAPAETGTLAGLVRTCPLTGPQPGGSQECRSLRHVFADEVAACMAELRADARARAGRPVRANAHSSRARRTTCEARMREELDLVLK